MQKSWASLSPTKKNLIVDSLIFLLVLVADAPHFTGDSLHEWIGLAFGATILVHLLLHWQWIVATTRHLFGKLAAQARINYALNILLFMDITLVTLSGLMISAPVTLPLLGIRPAQSGLWHPLHTSSADLFVILVGVHIALHWSWIVKSFGTYVVRPLAAQFGGALGDKQAEKKEISA